MTFSFDLDESVLAGLQRNARAELAGALESLEAAASGDDVVEAVHDVRKRCKRLRALARLARKAIGDDYAPSNRAFRDAARALADVRDSQVLVEAFDALLAAAPEGIALPDLRPARAPLVARHQRATGGLVARGERLDHVRSLLDEGAALVEGWNVDDDFDELAGGLAKTYGRARDGYERALEGPTTARLHEWRKRVKYHWHHVQLLTETDPVVLEPWADRLHDLADALGDDHDLAVLVQTIERDVDAHGGQEAVEVVRTLAAGRRADLQSRAFSLGARYTAEPAEAVVARLATMWGAWHRHGDAPQRTELADLTGDDLDGLTAQQLRRRAAHAGVAGRSRMRRDELAAALRAAGPT